MKRLNYYQVHRNKRPRRFKEKKGNVLHAKLASVALNSFAKHAIIVSSQFESIIDKQIAVLRNVQSHAIKVSNIIKGEKANRYLKTK